MESSYGTSSWGFAPLIAGLVPLSAGNPSPSALNKYDPLLIRRAETIMVGTWSVWGVRGLAKAFNARTI
ncbi:MAG: hypothetical protein IIA58_05370 [Candidatus Marinimicrobia bacterium]|nr:hypothetical protein [Candidatus Neomarinimicrobiota bacterium]